VLLRDAALLIIDLQKAIDDPRWAAHGPRNNPGAEAVVARLLAAWRREHQDVWGARDGEERPVMRRPRDARPEANQIGR